MFRTEEPDYEIKIGIKDCKIVSVDWSDMVLNDFTKMPPNKKIIKRVRRYLSLARKFIK